MAIALTTRVRLAETGDPVTSAATPELAVQQVQQGQIVNCPSDEFAASVLALLGLSASQVADRFRTAYGDSRREWSG